MAQARAAKCVRVSKSPMKWMLWLRIQLRNPAALKRTSEVPQRSVEEDIASNCVIFHRVQE
eukprot:2515033-Prymnesium_polylepis.2